MNLLECTSFIAENDCWLLGEALFPIPLVSLGPPQDICYPGKTDSHKFGKGCQSEGPALTVGRLDRTKL